MRVTPVNGKPSRVMEEDRTVEVSSFRWPRGSETAKGLIPAFDETGFGARVWGQVPQAFDVYYDDIAIGAERVDPVVYSHPNKNRHTQRERASRQWRANPYRSEAAGSRKRIATLSIYPKNGG